MLTVWLVWMAAALGADWARHPVNQIIGLPTELDLADLDDDGDLDLLYTGFHLDKVGWYENLGGGRFGPQQAFTTQTDGPRGVWAVDLDDDGVLDVLTSADDDRTVAWHRGLGGGAFGPREVIDDQAREAHQVIAADLDGDGKLDAVYAGEGFGVRWARNTGGAFANPVSLSTTPFTRWLTADDLDDDGDIDVVYGGPAARKMAWLPNQGGGTFDAEVVLNNDRLFEVVARDLDDDLDLDLLYIADNDLLAWHENVQGSTAATLFGPSQTLSTDLKNGRCVDTADFDDDGDLDIAMQSHWDGQVAWLEQTPTGFVQHTLSDRFLRAAAMAIGDVDGDGDPDLVASAKRLDTIEWFENDGGFTAPKQISRGATGVIDLTAADFDGDGILEPITVSWHDHRVTHWAGGRGFAYQWRLLEVYASRPTGATVADVDGDGDPDLVVAAAGAGQVTWHENRRGQLGSAQVLAQTEAAFVSAGDIDGDGDDDVVAASLGGDLRELENRPQGFRVRDVDSAPGVLMLDTPDLDGDGDPDVVAATGDGVVVWERRSGLKRIDHDVAARLVATADLDGDGILEVLAGGPEGTRTLEDKVLVAAETTGLDAGDVDCDGDADVVVQTPGGLKWLENRDGTLASPELIEPTHEVRPVAGRRVRVVDLDGRRAAEVLVADADVAVWVSPTCAPSDEPEPDSPPPQAEKDPKGCGCQTAPPLTGGWMLLIGLARRRPRPAWTQASAGRQHPVRPTARLR